MPFQLQSCCRRFQDSRGWCCAAYNEVAIDYNAAFTGAVARLVDFYDNMRPFSDCTLDLGWTHPNANLVRPTCAFSVCMRGAKSMYTRVCCRVISARSGCMANSPTFLVRGVGWSCPCISILHNLH